MNIENVDFSKIAGSKPTYKPYGNVLVLDYVPPESVGEIVLPKGSKPLFDFVTCGVIAVGPKAELVKLGDRILIASKAIMGVKHDGHEVWVTQENTILAVVEYNRMSGGELAEILRKKNDPVVP